MKLPTRKELPDYYEVIRRPVDIFKIQGKIDDGKVSVQIFLIALFCYILSSKKLNHIAESKIINFSFCSSTMI